MAPAPSSKSTRSRNADASTERDRKMRKRDSDEAGPSTSPRKHKSRDKSANGTKMNGSASPSKRDVSKERLLKEIAPSSSSRGHTGLGGDYWSKTPDSREPRSAKLNAERKIANEPINEDTEKDAASTPKSNGEAKKIGVSRSSSFPITTRFNGQAKNPRHHSKSPKKNNHVAPKTSKVNGEYIKKEDKSARKSLTTTPKQRNGASAKRNGEMSKKDKNDGKSGRKNGIITPKSSKANGEISKKTKTPTLSSKSRRSQNGTASSSKDDEEGKKRKSKKVDSDEGNDEDVKKRRRRTLKRPMEDSSSSESSSEGNDEDSDEEEEEEEQVEVVEEENDEEDEEGLSEEQKKEKEEKEKLDVLKSSGLHYAGKKYCLVKEKEKKEEGVKQKKQTRVERVLAGMDLSDGYLDNLNLQMEKKNKVNNNKRVFEIDYIAGSTDPKAPWGSGQAFGKNCKILIVYKGMPRGEWHEFHTVGMQNIPEIIDYVNTQKQMDKVEAVIREECAKRRQRFDRFYPARYLPDPEQNRFYASTDLEKLRTLQAARQADLNEQNAEDGAPPLYIADWSGQITENFKDEFLVNSINAFTFTNYPKFSRRVEKKLQSGNVERMDEHCKAECPCADPTVNGRCTCDPRKTKFSRRHECSGVCRCDFETCTNRIVQKGRQQPLIIMRHHKKGWTNRLFYDLKEGEFVHEYVGELVSYHENRSMDQTYALDQSDSLFDLSLPPNRKDQHKARRHNKGKPESGYCHRALVVNGLRAANEARFSSHGCRPKMRTVVTYVDRQSYGLHKTAFFADKDLRAGEELTWNYHGEELDFALENGEGFPSGILPECDCGETDCPISKNTKPCVSDAEPDDDVDSFLDSDEEKEREESESRKNDRKSRLEKRDQRKSSNAENESTPPPPAPQSRPNPRPKRLPTSPVSRRLSFSPQL